MNPVYYELFIDFLWKHSNYEICVLNLTYSDNISIYQLSCLLDLLIFMETFELYDTRPGIIGTLGERKQSDKKSVQN